MKKIFSFFAAILFAGSMMAADAKVTLDFSDAGWGFPTTSATTEESYTNGGFTITVNASNGHKNQGDKALLFGKQDATITLPTLSFNVSKIVVKGNAGASGKVTFNIFVGSDPVSDEATSSLVDHEFAILSTKQAAGTVYVIKVTNANNCQISAVEFYEAVAGAPENPTFSVAAGVYTDAQSVELACATTGAEIYYTLDGTDPTSSSTKYTAAIPVNETTTIKAVAIKNSVSSSVVSARYKIISLTGAGTEGNPYTVADVIALENSRSDTAWVKGYILGGAATEGNPSAFVVKELDGSNTAIAIADAADETDNTKMVSVQVGKNIRSGLAAAGNDGKLVKVRGALELYLTVPGVKGLTKSEHYVLDSSTAIDNTAEDAKVVKTIENGQLVIIKNGVKYNTQGTQIR